MKKRLVAWLVGLLLALGLLTGCSGKNTAANDTTSSEYGQKEIYEMNMLGAGDFRAFSHSDNRIYFIGVHEDTDKRDIYRYDVDSNVSSLFATVDDGIFIDYAAVTEDTEDIVYVLTLDSDAFRISTVDSDGNLRMLLEQDCDVRAEGYPKFMLVGEKEFFVAFKNLLKVIKKDGSATKTIDCTNMTFENGIVCENGEILFTLSINARTYNLSAYVPASGELVTKCEMKDTIFHLLDKAGELFAVSRQGISRVDRGTYSLNKVVGFDYHGISASETQTVFLKDKSFYLVTEKSGASSGIKLVKLSPSNEETVKKQSIKIFCTDNSSSDLTEIELIKAYNEQSTEYIAEIVENDGPFDVTFLQKEKPDVIYYFIQDTAVNYIDKGFCEDLYPFLEENGKVDADDINSKAYEIFGKGNHLYAIPTSVSAETLLVPTRTRQGNDGWTADEYIRWLKENPDVCALGGMTKQRILLDCLYGIVDEYVDISNGTVGFTNGKFEKILNKILELPAMQNEESVYVSTTLAGKYDYTNMKYLKRELVQSAYELAQKEYCLGDEFVFAGFPNASRTPISRATCNSIFSIFSESANKAGAFDFIVFALKYQFYRLNGEDFNRPYGKAWVLNSLADIDLSNVVGEFVINTSGTHSTDSVTIKVTEQDVNLYRDVIESSTALPTQKSRIIDIVMEESEAFFAGNKSAEDVCKIIQSRAEIVVQESSDK